MAYRTIDELGGQAGSDSLSKRLKIAVVGSGISGMSAAWLLSRRHDVTMFEAGKHIGGHSNTVDALGVPVDTGFIVYNETTYPNLTALFDHLNVPTKKSAMSFSVSLENGRLEYAGTIGGLFGQLRNLLSPRYREMLRGLVRFYRNAPRDLHRIGASSLGDYLDGLGCGNAFREDHLYPMAAAIWSTPPDKIADYPAAAFIRFCENHGLLKFIRRPRWRTVDGGSREYVKRLIRPFEDRIRTNCPVESIRDGHDSVTIISPRGEEQFDHVVIATHADHALKMLATPTEDEREVLGAFSYRYNRAVLHSDPRFMPRQRSLWSSWNYSSDANDSDPHLSVTYWMNRLQGIADDKPLFVTLNPLMEPSREAIHGEFHYDHPMFDKEASAAQGKLWSLQGKNSRWYCGAHFGSGFHEDGLQAGLAVAEQLGDVKRPWRVAGESGRIMIDGESATAGWAGRGMDDERLVNEDAAP